MMDVNEEIDMTLALQLQAQFEEELRASIQSQEANHQKSHGVPGPSNKSKRKNHEDLEEPQQEKLSVSLVDPSWELIDPNPDLHTLFLTFDNQFFWGRLYQVEVKWSTRMTLCAGVCSYEGRGGLCSIRLSQPLLKLRPRKDFIETLLHEMIHAYLFVTANNKDRDGHGPEFHKHMYRINGIAGTKITVYHSFHDEVAQYRQHIWQCDGPCRYRKPYFGLVKRSMNRAPSPRDPWWGQHQQSCGGTYTKIQEPEGYGVKKKKAGSAAEKNTNKGADIRKMFGETSKKASVGTGFNSSNKGSSVGNKSPPLKENIPGYSGRNTSGLPNSEKKTSNIHGLGSTATGTVKQVNVNNASRSNVHGFSRGSGSPAKKKPRIGGNGNTSTGSSTPDRTRKGQGSGTALASRGGGSRTVTVKGKTVTKTENSEEMDTTENSDPPPTAFHGSGYSLGGSSTGVSRLLSLSAPSTSTSIHTNETSNRDSTSSEKHSQQSKIKKETSVHKNTGWISRSPTKGKSPQKKHSSPGSQKSIDTFFKPSTSQPVESKDDSGVKCPVCNKTVPQRLINKHLDKCVGDFDDDDDFETSDKKRENESTDKTSFIKKKQGACVNTADKVILLSSDDEQSPMKSHSKNVLSRPSSSGVPEVISLQEQKYPCPICNGLFTESDMNSHLDTHF